MSKMFLLIDYMHECINSGLKVRTEKLKCFSLSLKNLCSYISTYFIVQIFYLSINFALEKSIRYILINKEIKRITEMIDKLHIIHIFRTFLL